MGSTTILNGRGWTLTRRARSSRVAEPRSEMLEYPYLVGGGRRDRLVSAQTSAVPPLRPVLPAARRIGTRD
jgi:hypothetical protein